MMTKEELAKLQECEGGVITEYDQHIGKTESRIQSIKLKNAGTHDEMLSIKCDHFTGQCLVRLASIRHEVDATRITTPFGMEWELRRD